METSLKGVLNMTKETDVDFNVFVGAETGILKGLNVHSKGNIVKNFHNLKSLDKQYEITCASFGDGEGEILMGLRNQSVKVCNWNTGRLKYCRDIQSSVMTRHRCMMLLSGHSVIVWRHLGALAHWWELQGHRL